MLVQDQLTLVRTRLALLGRGTFFAGVFWNVGLSATPDVNTSFMGNILALASATVDFSSTGNCGRVLADTGAVTLDENSLREGCAGPLAGRAGLSGGRHDYTPGGFPIVTALPFLPIDGPGGTAPEPCSLTPLGLGLAGRVFVARGRMRRLIRIRGVGFRLGTVRYTSKRSRWNRGPCATGRRRDPRGNSDGNVVGKGRDRSALTDFPCQASERLAVNRDVSPFHRRRS